MGGGGRAAGCSVQGAGVLILTGKLDAYQYYPAKLGLNKRMNKLHLIFRSDRISSVYIVSQWVGCKTFSKCKIVRV